jgi:nucleotide-binding universal stress UspA family protein
MFKHILLPTDGSQLSRKAARQAIALAKQLHARITALHVVGEYQVPFLDDDGFVIPGVPDLKKRFEDMESVVAQKILDAVKRSAVEADVECNAVTVASNLPYEAIARQAKKSGCDMIVMASHGRKGLQGLLIGSETSKVLTHSTIPVLVVR